MQRNIAICTETKQTQRDKGVFVSLCNGLVVSIGLKRPPVPGAVGPGR
jgi:hypothetical protein